MQETWNLNVQNLKAFHRILSIFLNIAKSLRSQFLSKKKKEMYKWLWHFFPSIIHRSHWDSVNYEPQNGVTYVKGTYNAIRRPLRTQHSNISSPRCNINPGPGHSQATWNSFSLPLGKCSLASYHLLTRNWMPDSTNHSSVKQPV